jgi:ribose transport system substrate-binding protein
VSRILRLSVIAALAAVVACVPACSKKDTGKIKIGIVTNCTAEFWSICEAGANKAAQENDVELLFRQPEKNDAAVQMPIVDSFIKQGVKGIAVSVIEPEAQTKALALVAGKVPLITMDNDADQSGRLCYIGIDNYEGGKAAGRLVKKALPNGGTVGVFIGSVSSANGKARTQGVLDELAGQKDAPGVEATHPLKPDLKGKMYGKYFIVDSEAKTDATSSDTAYKNAAGVLGRVKTLPDLCMVGLYAYNPPAILKAAKELSLVGKAKIVAFDEDWDTLKAIAAGEIEGTVVQDPFMYGYRSVEALAAKARGDDSKMVKEAIPYRIVTKDGGPDETVNGLVVKNPKVADFEAKLRADLASAKK